MRHLIVVPRRAILTSFTVIERGNGSLFFTGLINIILHFSGLALMPLLLNHWIAFSVSTLSERKMVL